VEQTGTGKELIARALYPTVIRAQAPFIAVNLCGHSGALLESELFGHERGAFTGANLGASDASSKPTTERFSSMKIGHMTPGTQVKLVASCKSSVLQRVGGKDRSRSTCA